MTNNQSNELIDEVAEILKPVVAACYDLEQTKPKVVAIVDESLKKFKALIQDRERQARINEHELLQHQATVNLKSAKAVAGWSEVRVKQLKGDKS